MPTAGGYEIRGFCADVPLLVVRRRGWEQLYPADMVTLTAESAPPPAVDAVREAAEYVLAVILEDLDNVRARIAELWTARRRHHRAVTALPARPPAGRCDFWSSAFSRPESSTPSAPGHIRAVLDQYLPVR
jgi:hypothetical protein